ncbi:hypothetical protein ABMA27_007809 [Loxostege sticticalis]|uniref:DDE Tnp4 domain-containing protein n=1 Tax=Loxostege sticticalis TaxID=481309 RepID=A0ABR3HCY0_LOXSC
MARYLLIEHALAEEQMERIRRRRCLRQAALHHLPSDADFITSFRLTRALFEELCCEVIPLLPPKKNTRSIDPVTKILSALSFYARGCYQGAVAKDMDAPMAQQKVSKCLRQVTDVLNLPQIVRKYVRFPQNTSERNIIKRGFYDKYQLPAVCGCIDCTHIALIRPHIHEERFFNRKGYHSLNVQVICDVENKILNLDASYGSATHDSFIWHNSPVKEHFETLCRQGERAFLLGDSGYPLREFMMIPVEGASEDSPEGRYNAVQKSARCTIERTFGILKGRWRCLLSARELHYSPQTAGKIIIACAVLHNMCISAQLEPFELSAEELMQEANMQPVVGGEANSGNSGIMALQRGRAVRQQIINQFL